MPQAPVNGTGTVLYYEDTGPPGTSTDYTTIVMVHGMVFHSATFHRLLPHARKHNIRLVLLNMRDYPGSSPFSPDELAAFSTSPREAIKELGHQFAAFLAHFVQTHDVPEIKLVEGKKTVGGIALVTWSFSNTIHMSLLAHAHTLTKETKTLLERYWRRSVMYDPALGNIGLAAPAGVYSPLRDTSLSLQLRGDEFLTWASSYFPLVPSTALETYTVDDLLTRQALAEEPSFLHSQLPAAYMQSSTVERMTVEQLQSITDVDVLARSTEAMRAVPREVYEDNARKALWEPEVDPDSDSEGCVAAFPGLSVLVLWFDMSVGDCIWAAKVLNDGAGRRLSERGGRPTRLPRARDVDVVCVQGLNHFAHWDDPERVMDALAEHV